MSLSTLVLEFASPPVKRAHTHFQEFSGLLYRNCRESFEITTQFDNRREGWILRFRATMWKTVTAGAEYSFFYRSRARFVRQVSSFQGRSAPYAVRPYQTVF